MFEIVDRRTDNNGRMTEGRRNMGILKAHLMSLTAQVSAKNAFLYPSRVSAHAHYKLGFDNAEK